MGKNTWIILLIAVIILIITFSLLRNNTKATGNNSGLNIISSEVVNYDTSSGVMKVLFVKFQTNDVSNIDKNKKIAEQILPSAIKQADSINVRTIAIQAVQYKYLLLVRTYKAFGYVWEKNNRNIWLAK